MPRVVEVSDEENADPVVCSEKTNETARSKPTVGSSTGKPGSTAGNNSRANCDSDGEIDQEHFVDDVEQDDTDRKEIRNNIRSLITDIQNNQLDYTDPNSDVLTDTLDRANYLFGKIRKTREGALDSQLVLNIAQCGRQKAQRLHTDFLVFSPKNFILKATSAITRLTLDRIENGSEDIPVKDWETLGRQAQHLFRTSPNFQYMFGAVAREPVEARPKKERRVKDKETNAKTAIKQLKTVKEASTKEATSGEVENIYQLLCEETKPETDREDSRPMCYFDFVINPHSFSQTVENIFYTSFLAKDGWAKISLDDDKLPVIEPLERPKEGTEQARERQDNKTQVVMAFTMREWKEIIEAYGITEPTIPTRPPHYTAAKRKHNS